MLGYQQIMKSTLDQVIVIHFFEHICNICQDDAQLGLRNEA